MLSIIIILVIALIVVLWFAIQSASKVSGLEEKLKAQAELAQQKEIIIHNEDEEHAKKMADAKVHTAVLYQRSVLKGKISEQMAPYLSGFPADLEPSEAHFLGSPIDFIVFKGANNKHITEIVFVEVKSGKIHLNENESSLKETIENKNVRYVSYHIPEEIFSKENPPLSATEEMKQPTKLPETTVSAV